MSGATTGGVRLVLRLEGLCVLIAASVAYSKFGLGWGTFALFFFTPDLSFLGFLFAGGLGWRPTLTLRRSIGGGIAGTLGIGRHSPQSRGERGGDEGLKATVAKKCGCLHGKLLFE